MAGNDNSKAGLFRRLAQNEITWVAIFVVIALNIQGNFSEVTKGLEIVKTTMAQVVKNTDGLASDVDELKDAVSTLRADYAALKAQLEAEMKAQSLSR